MENYTYKQNEFIYFSIVFKLNGKIYYFTKGEAFEEGSVST